MARIGNDLMIVHVQQRQDTTWLFTICYTAHFSDSDIGKRFDDSVRIGDAGGGYIDPVTFTASSPKVFRKKRIVVRDGAFGKDTRTSALCVSVRLHRA